MYKKFFEKLNEQRNKLNAMEEELKELEESVGKNAGEQITRALCKLIAFRDRLWVVDKALEVEKDSLRQSRKSTNNSK
jgi:predicted phage gp36 major capsid-like protein